MLITVFCERSNQYIIDRHFIKVKILQFDTLVATFACLFLGNGTRKRKSVDGQQKVISSINSKKKETAFSTGQNRKFHFRQKPNCIPRIPSCD
jgi:hypothetical protein